MKTNIVKDYVAEAFLVLLEQKEYKDISVVELTKKAGVARSSFYRNFNTVEDVADYLIAQLFEDICEEGMMTTCNVREYVQNTYETALRYGHELSLLVKNGLSERVRIRFAEIVRNQTAELNAFDNNYQEQYYAAAASAVFLGWVENQFEETPERISEIFTQCLRGGYIADWK